jgi:tRNA-specific 2-thiouridylase
MQKILLAMSGGIDSSVCGIILKEQGFDIHGITYLAYDLISKNTKNKEPHNYFPGFITEAKKMADKMDINHTTIDFRKEFKRIVIKNFTEEYFKGRTPNPCVLCNKVMKWEHLLKLADKMGYEKIATGHYAQIKNTNNRYYLTKSIDSSKDQSYFLWKLTQEKLARTVFPLGKFLKSEIREIAKKHGFYELSQKRESQEVCFIPDDDYRKFLNETEPEKIKQIGYGDYILSDGKKVGTHKGYPFYTIGQRKGLGISLGEPYFVTNINAEKNQITLGKRNELKVKAITVTDVNLMKYEIVPPEGLQVNVKIRYRSVPEPAMLFKKRNKFFVEFSKIETAVSPGQSSVFYEDDDVVGGGIINDILK